jgi:hypothetical protein
MTERLQPIESLNHAKKVKNRYDFKRFLSFLSQYVTNTSMSSHFSLPGIKSIAYLIADGLTEQLAMQSLAGLPIYIHIANTPIGFNGEPTCECTQSNAAVSPSQSVEFSFQSTEQLPDDRYLSILVTDVNGRSYLIGTKEEHPVIERVQSFGNPDSDPSTFTYNVTLTAPRALIPCTIP